MSVFKVPVTPSTALDTGSSVSSVPSSSSSSVSTTTSSQVSSSPTPVAAIASTTQISISSAASDASASPTDNTVSRDSFSTNVQPSTTMSLSETQAAASTAAGGPISTTVGTTASSPSASVATTSVLGKNDTSHYTSHSITGAGVGVGIAAGVVIGAIFGLLAMWMLLRSKTRKQQRPNHTPAVYSDTTPGNAPSNEKSALIATTSVASSSHDDMLPLPIETSALLKDLSTIRNTIRNHAGDFYHAKVLDPGVVKNLQANLANSELVIAPFTPKSLAASLANVEVRTEAIIFLLSSTVLSKLDPMQTGTTTLLPGGLVTCLRDMSSHQSIQSTDRSHLINKWRVMTGYLLGSQNKKGRFSGEDARLYDIETITQALDSVLALLAKSDRLADRHANLGRLLERVADFGLVLVSQPSRWTFDWAVPAGRGSVMTVFPSLLQVTDDNGANLVPFRSHGQKDVSQGLRW